MAFGTWTNKDYRLLALIWLGACVFFVLRQLLGPAQPPLLADNDDAMRLVVVRDFLAGQNWFDHSVARLDVPDGGELHWSRLIDVPIAGLILLFKPFLGTGADAAAAIVWPLLLLVPLLALSGALSMRLAGREALLPALILPLASLGVLNAFGPGRLDHHNVQIILTLALVYALVLARQSHGAAAAAGLVAGLSLAIGLETLPYVAAAVLVTGLYWVADPRQARALRFFGFSFALSTVLALAVTWPPALWFTPQCDVISITYAAAALGVALAYGLLTLMPLNSGPWWLRLGAAAIAGVAVLGIVLVLFPQCSMGPYGTIDPWLAQNWLPYIEEAKSLPVSLATNTALTLGLCLPLLLALMVVFVQLLRGPGNRPEWAVLALFIALSLAVGVLQVRGPRLAAPLIAPAGALLIVWARNAYLRRSSIATIAGLAGAWFGFAGLVIYVLVGLGMQQFAPASQTHTGNVPEPASEFACLEAEAFTGLAVLPPRNIMAPVDLGARLLVYTPHSVVAAPYHRNARAIRDALTFFTAPAAAARKLLDDRDIDMIVVCAGLPEMAGFGTPAPDSFLAALKSDAEAEWYEELPLEGGPLRAFAVRR